MASSRDINRFLDGSYFLHLLFFPGASLGKQNIYSDTTCIQLRHYSYYPSPNTFAPRRALADRLICIRFAVLRHNQPTKLWNQRLFNSCWLEQLPIWWYLFLELVLTYKKYFQDPDLSRLSLKLWFAGPFFANTIYSRFMICLRKSIETEILLISCFSWYGSCWSNQTLNFVNPAI